MLVHTRQKSNVFNSSSELHFQPKDIESVYLMLLIDVWCALKGLEKTEKSFSTCRFKHVLKGCLAKKHILFSLFLKPLLRKMPIRLNQRWIYFPYKNKVNFILDIVLTMQDDGRSNAKTNGGYSICFSTWRLFYPLKVTNIVLTHRNQEISKSTRIKKDRYTQWFYLIVSGQTLYSLHNVDNDILIMYLQLIK